jgi:thiol-disulfide isomerase/thioredoxin
MSESRFAKSSESERQLLPPERARFPLWPWLLLLVGLVVAMMVRAGLTKPEPERRGETDPAVGTEVTTFRLEPLTGDSRQITEADLQGKVTLVNFWGPWCTACVVEFPHLVELEEHFRAQPGFQFYSISSNYDPRDEQGLAEGTERFLKQHQATFPTYRDPQGQTIIDLIKAAKIEEFGYPATVLLGPGGLIRGLWIGYVPGDEKAVRQAIEKALAEMQKKS